MTLMDYFVKHSLKIIVDNMAFKSKHFINIAHIVSLSMCLVQKLGSKLYFSRHHYVFVYFDWLN